MNCPFKNCAKFLAMPYAAWLLFAVSVGSLLFAFIMQYGFGYEPCVLCLWQRAPFGVAACLALFAIFKKPYSKMNLALIAATFAVGAGLAVFHTGVEQHWWMGTTGCGIQPLNANSIKDLRTQILNTVVARCDQISWTFLGLSMTNYNVALSAALAAFSGIAAWRAK